MLTGRRLVIVGALLYLGTLVSQCAPPPAPEPALTPAVSLFEVMQSIVDPIADNIFDAVGYEITAKGTVETKPLTDEDWAKVRSGAVTLAEATSLLKIPRPIEPPGHVNEFSSGPNAPELTGAQIQVLIDADRAKWNRHADELRVMALEVLEIVKRKDVDALFDAGGRLDKACENCHLEYWYPGDKKAVLEDERQRATPGTAQPSPQR